MLFSLYESMVRKSPPHPSHCLNNQILIDIIQLFFAKSFLLHNDRGNGHVLKIRGFSMHLHCYKVMYCILAHSSFDIFSDKASFFQNSDGGIGF
jgi:hypothetical protein